MLKLGSMEVWCGDKTRTIEAKEVVNMNNLFSWDVTNDLIYGYGDK